MALSDTVNVSIVASTQYPTAPGFGVPLILGYHTKFAELVRYYTNLAAMVADGFAISDPCYLAAAAMQAQNPAPPRWAIGRRTNIPTRIINLTPAISAAGAAKVVVYTLTVNGTDYTYTTDGTATVKEIVEGLVAAYAGPHGGVTATEDDTKLVLTGTAGTWFSWAVADNDGNANGMGLWTVADVTADSSADLDLAACAAADSGWYAFCSTFQNAIDGAKLAIAAESLKRLQVIDLADTILKTVSGADLASTVKTATEQYTAVAYHAKVSEFLSAAWLGNCLPYDPGSETWKFKTLAAITADILTDGETTYLNSKRANWYLSEAGVNLTHNGTTGKSGMFIDVVRFIDWLRANMQIDVFGVMANAAKVPYTDAGVAAIENVIRARLALGVGVGGLTRYPAPTVTVSRVANETAANRAARTIPDIYFTATLAGAVHSMTINGVVSV